MPSEGSHLLANSILEKMEEIDKKEAREMKLLGELETAREDREIA